MLYILRASLSFRYRTLCNKKSAGICRSGTSRPADSEYGNTAHAERISGEVERERGKRGEETGKGGSEEKKERHLLRVNMLWVKMWSS